MKKLSECLNPKSGKITEEAYDYLFKVSGGAEAVAWNLHLLADYLDKTYTLDYDGDVSLQVMAARVDAISNEIVDLINLIDEKGLEP
jgi:hypothetical protein